MASLHITNIPRTGTNFYVGTDDKDDALEDTNEVRQILDDLGNLLGHSKRDDLYPKDGTTGGVFGPVKLWGRCLSKPADEAVIGYKPASEAEKG